ncbi:MAG: RNA 3'-phosphate cyclase, partial [Deltaproteobacteria bacterium]
MNLHEPIIIDGGYGEGGGQVVRTSLSLAMITGRPVRLVNIRGGRKKPGLRPQHLTAVQACVAVTNARVEGAELGSQELSLFPSTVRAGTYHFNIGTAGAVTLVVQTVLPALALAEGKTFLTVRGGTHVPWSPPFQYFAEVFLPTTRQLGNHCEASIARWGWYPKGGGEIQVKIERYGSSVAGLVDQPFELQRITGLSA